MIKNNTPIFIFLSAHGASAFALGVHQVLLAWLSVTVLQLDSHALGWVQAAGLLPNLVFMLVAGALADKRGAFTLLWKAQLGLTFCYLSLALLLAFNQLGLFSLIVYASLVGTANAFLQPSREKVIGELSEHRLQTKITRASSVQFSLQGLGVLVAALSDNIGFVFVILVQSLFSFMATMQMLNLKRFSEALKDKAHITELPESLLQQILQGIRVVARDTRIAQLIGLIGFNGYMHLGVYIVVVPLLARDVYQFTALQYGLLQFAFIAGMLSAYIIISFKKQIDYPGQGALFSLLYTAILGFALSKQPTETGLYMLIVFWGWVAGNSATHCRMVVQLLVPIDTRARVMSLYQIVLFGMAPLGAIVTGHFAKLYTLNFVFTVLSATSVAMFVFFLFTRSLWAVKCK
ncbi:Transmembrane secretion effector [Alteromonadaceae bacterium Bs31]|nr:Transmembrane secretion effector [Alteromonadaceae bacterium Bs31]